MSDYLQSDTAIDIPLARNLVLDIRYAIHNMV